MIYFPGTISGIIYKMKMFLLAKMFTKNPIRNWVCSVTLSDICIQLKHTKFECLYRPLKIAK